MNVVSPTSAAEGSPTLASSRCRARVQAFTLLESVLVIGALSALAGVGYIAFSDIDQGASSAKIQSDVATVNEAVLMYRASGGDLSGAKSPNQVLAKLKTEQTAAQAATSALPITGSLIDRRLVAEMQTVREAATTQPRALWNEADNLFEVKTSGVVGVKRFRLDASLSDEEIITEARGDEFYAFNGNAGWVWDTGSKGGGNDSPDDVLLGPSPVQRTAFPDAPVTSASQVVNSAIVAGAEASAPAPVQAAREPALAPSTEVIEQAQMVIDPVTDQDALAGTGVQSPSFVESGLEGDLVAAVTDPVETPEQVAMEEMLKSMELAGGELSGDFSSGGGLSSIFEDFANMLGDGSFGTGASADGSTGDPDTNEPAKTEPSASRLPRPVVDKPGGGYLMSDFPLDIQIVNEGDYEGRGKVIYRRDWEDWQPYMGGIKMLEDERLSVKAVSEDPEKILDSYEVNESYFAAAHIFSGVTEGDYTDVQGGPALVYSLTENNSFLSHGRPVIVIDNYVIDGGEANSLKFLLSQFSGVTAGVPFRIGDLLYHNGTTYDATHATSTTLHVEVVFTEPLAAKELKIPLELINTENSDDADASADYVRLREPNLVYPLELDGRLYDMTIAFGEADAYGFSSPDEFHAYEGQTARVALMATLIDKGRKPGGNQWGDWLKKVIENWLAERGYR